MPMLAYFTLAIALFSMTSLRPIRMRKYRATFSRKGKP